VTKGLDLSALPALEDVVFIIVLLVPGFFALVLFKKIGMREKQMSDYESTIWSLFASLGIYAVFGYFTGMFNLNSVRDNILNPFNIASVFSLAIAFGGGFGLLARLMFRQRYVSGDCWEKCMKAAASMGSYLLVYTSSNEEYKGELLFGSVSEAQKEIVIRNPKRISRDSDLGIKAELKMGRTMLFNERDIRRIVFLKDIFEKPKAENRNQDSIH
jgi:hypothetical protein